TARFGLSVGAVSGFATLIWLPTGISLAALFLFGYNLWPAIAAGAFAVNILTGAPLLVAGGIAIGNTLEVLIGAFLLRRFRFQPSFSTLRDVFLLIFLATPVSTAISATIGIFSLWRGGVIPSAATVPTWIPWWVGDAVSNIIVSPLIFVYCSQPLVRK